MIYFDYTATTKPSLELLELHQKINKEYWFNTETLYNEGIKGNALLEKSEKVVIDLILKNGKARAVRFSTLEAICRELDCQPGDIIEYRPESGPQKTDGDKE